MTNFVSKQPFPRNDKPFSKNLTVIQVKTSEKKYYQYFYFKMTLHQARKWIETYFVVSKML